MLGRTEPCIDRDHHTIDSVFPQFAGHEQSGSPLPHAHFNDEGRAQSLDAVGQVPMVRVPALNRDLKGVRRQWGERVSAIPERRPSACDRRQGADGSYRSNS